MSKAFSGLPYNKIGFLNDLFLSVEHGNQHGN